MIVLLMKCQKDSFIACAVISSNICTNILSQVIVDKKNKLQTLKRVLYITCSKDSRPAWQGVGTV